MSSDSNDERWTAIAERRQSTSTVEYAPGGRAPPPHGFWPRRVLQPIRAQPTQGVFTVADVLPASRNKSVSDFLGQFGWAGVHALTAWLLTSPVLMAVIYFSARPALRRAWSGRAP